MCAAFKELPVLSVYLPAILMPLISGGAGGLRLLLHSFTHRKLLFNNRVPDTEV